MNPGRAGLLAAVSVLLAGCASSIRFAADTVVDEQGNVVRTTRIASSGESAYDELMAHYDLPAGGVWSETNEEVPSSGPSDGPFGNQPSRVYEREYSVTREFARGETIPGDFRRVAAVSNRAAENAVLVRSRHYWFVDRYDYEERFRDIVSFEGFSMAVREGYGAAIEIMADEIADLDIDAVSLDVARERLRLRFDQDLESFFSFIESECVDRSIALDDCADDLQTLPELSATVAMLEDDQRFSAELAELFPAPPDRDAESWPDLLATEVIDDVERRFGDYADDVWFDEFEEELFGVHGFTLFQSFPFELSLSMPGAISSSNADSNEMGMLRWTFSNDDFLMTDRVLHASSRVVHRTRIVAAIAFTLVIAITASLVVLSRERS